MPVGDVIVVVCRKQRGIKNPSGNGELTGLENHMSV